MSAAGSRWRRRPATVVLLVLLVLLAAAGCRVGAGPDGATPAGPGGVAAGSVGASPAEGAAIGAAATDVTVPAGVGPSPAAMAAAAAAADPTGATLPSTAKVGLPPVGREARNVLGEPVRLDETASLACAHAQFTIDALDGADPDLAARELSAVVRWGRPSANAEISAAAGTLVVANASPGQLRAGAHGFLAVCRAAGHL